MYVSMNWECCSCENMYTNQFFNFCTKKHVFCSDCFEVVYPTDGCPECRKDMQDPLAVAPDEPQTPSSSSELPTDCRYKDDGCRYVPTDPLETFKHIQGCKLRLHSCEGSQFGLWKCGWSGNYIQIEKHFQQEHKDHFNLLRSSVEVVVTLNLCREQRTVQVIKHKGELFYYKHRLDPVQRKFFVIVQMVGPEESAQKFLYQYKLKNDNRVLSVQEICQSDASPIKYYFKLEKCVVVSLNMLKSYMNGSQLKFEIRILKRDDADDNAGVS